MKSIKEFSKEWCSEHSNKGCKEQCDGCWQIKSTWGCEQHNMELACEAGANYVLDLLIEEDNKYDNIIECYPALTRIIRELKK